MKFLSFFYIAVSAFVFIYSCVTGSDNFMAFMLPSVLASVYDVGDRIQKAIKDCP